MKTDSQSTNTPHSSLLQIAGYAFFDLKNPEEIRFPLRDYCRSLELRGTILLSEEGMNTFIAGTPEAIKGYKDYVHHHLGFPEVAYKESTCRIQPYSRMLVKVKKEIITTGVEGLHPHVQTGEYLSPQKLKAWLDEGKEFHLLDTRNDYEVALGKFKGAQDLQVKSFRDFIKQAPRRKSEWSERSEQPLVMYCTGGIRCEKASAYFLKELGFEKVYQLQGGILQYLKECGDKHYEGVCFVFDKRVGLDQNLEQAEYVLCYRCQTALSAEDQKSPAYQPPKSCPHCMA